MPYTRFFHSDKEDPSFTTVTYIDPHRVVPNEHELKKLTAARDRKMDIERARACDPLYVYHKCDAEHQICWARRIRRDPKYATHLAYETPYWEPTDYDDVKHDENPTCPGCYRYVKAKLMAGPVCTYCRALPIPYLQGQNWDPVIVDNRPRDEYGNMIDSRGGPRPKRSAEAIRLAKVEAETYVAKQFDPEFIKSVILRRNERYMTQEEVAHMVNRQISDIKRFELGEMTFDAALKSQLMWKLGLASSTTSEK